jgi:hypothetical protein
LRGGLTRAAEKKEESMVAVMLMSVAAIVLLCIAAYTLATYALPFMLSLAAARFAYHTGAGLIGAGFVGLLVGAVAFGVLVRCARQSSASSWRWSSPFRPRLPAMP